MDEQTRAGPGELFPSKPGDDVVGQLHPFERLAEDELAGMEDEGLVAVDARAARSGRPAPRAGR